MNSIFIFLLGLLIGSAYGNMHGDQLTIKDCAVSGRAAMAGGGDITCAVVKK